MKRCCTLDLDITGYAEQKNSYEYVAYLKI